MMAGSSTRSLNHTLAKAAPETIRCSRHNDGEPFELRKERGLAESATLVYTDLERILSKRMMRPMKPAPATGMMQMFKNGGNKEQKQQQQQHQQEQQMQQQAFLCPGGGSTNVFVCHSQRSRMA